MNALAHCVEALYAGELEIARRGASAIDRWLSPTYHVPGSLAGQPRLHTEDAQKFEQSMIDEGKKYDVNFHADITNPDAHRVKSKKEALENFDKAITWAMQLVSKMSDDELSAPVPNTPLMPPWYTLDTDVVG